MLKKCVPLLILLLCLSLLVSCAANKAPMPMEPMPEAAPPMAAEPDYGEANMNGVYPEEPALETPTADQEIAEDMAPVEPPAANAAPPEYERKIIRNADISLEVSGVEKAYEKILDWAKKNGGYESSRHMELGNGKPYISATIKIKAENLDAFLTHTKTVGKTLDSSIRSDEVTDQYYDLETRLKTMRKTLDKYYEFLAETKTVKEMLEVQSSIDRMTLEIESIEGQLRLLKAMVAESTVNLTLSEKPDVVTDTEEEIIWSALSFGDMLTLTGRMFVRVGNFFVSLLQWLVIASPILLILLAVYLILRISIKRYRKKHPKLKTPPPAAWYAPVPSVSPPQAPVPPAQPISEQSSDAVDEEK